MGKVIVYTCDGEACKGDHGSSETIVNAPDCIPEGWYTQVSCMGRSIKYLCPDCYKRMCMTDNGFLGGD